MTASLILTQYHQVATSTKLYCFCLGTTDSCTVYPGSCLSITLVLIPLSAPEEMCLIVKTGCCQFGLICCMCIHYPVSNYVADSVLKCLISYLNKLLLMHAWILSSELLLILLRQFLRHPPIHPMLQGGNRAKMIFGHNFWLGGPIDTRLMRLNCILQGSC